MSTTSTKSIPTYDEVCNLFMPGCTNIHVLYHEYEIYTQIQDNYTLSIPIPTDIPLDSIESCNLFELTMSSAPAEINNNIGFAFHGYIYSGSAWHFYGFFRDVEQPPQILSVKLGAVIRGSRTQSIILSTTSGCFFGLIIITLRCLIGK